MEKLKHNFSELHGEFRIENQIPLGAGMGASAAICVATGRWLQAQGYIQEPELQEFCRQLENLFHGESSGVDIAVALTGRGIKFQRGAPQLPIEIKWSPNWYISYCGQRGITSECVNQVKGLIQHDSVRGKKLDLQMRDVVEGAERALQINAEEGFPLLCDAVNLAGHTFSEWGLTGGALGRHIERLRSAGAVAVKPTGSGGGGYVLSIWKTPAPDQIDDFELIPL